MIYANFQTSVKFILDQCSTSKTDFKRDLTFGFGSLIKKTKNSGSVWMDENTKDGITFLRLFNFCHYKIQKVLLYQGHWVAVLREFHQNESNLSRPLSSLGSWWKELAWKVTLNLLDISQFDRTLYKVYILHCRKVINKSSAFNVNWMCPLSIKKRNIARMVILENIFVLNSTLHGAVNMISKCTFLQRTSIGVLPLKIPARQHFPFIDWLLHFCSTCSRLNNAIKDEFFQIKEWFWSEGNRGVTKLGNIKHCIWKGQIKVGYQL